MADTSVPVFTYDQFVAQCMTVGFEVKNADFGGFKIGMYLRDVGTKEIYFTGPEDMIGFIQDLYGLRAEAETDNG